MFWPISNQKNNLHHVIRKEDTKMSVHLKIAEQVTNHRRAQKEFLALDEKREAAIDRVVEDAKKGLHISLNEVNAITKEMNQIAQDFYFPPRKEVTTDMVREYINKSK